MITLYDLRSREKIETLKGHKDDIKCLFFDEND